MVGKFKQEQHDFAQQISQILSQKPEFVDLEAIAHKIHTKADTDKVESLFIQLRKEVID